MLFQLHLSSQYRCSGSHGLVVRQLTCMYPLAGLLGSLFPVILVCFHVIVSVTRYEFTQKTGSLCCRVRLYGRELRVDGQQRSHWTELCTRHVENIDLPCIDLLLLFQSPFVAFSPSLLCSFTTMVIIRCVYPYIHLMVFPPLMKQWDIDGLPPSSPFSLPSWASSHFCSTSLDHG